MTEILRTGLQVIVAMDPEGIIGHQNQLPWHLPKDLQHFRRLTLGHTVIMGRRTFESIGKPLPGRHNLVLTRQENWTAEGVTILHSLPAALAVAPSHEVFVIGGAALFAEALPQAEILHRTLVLDRYPGDVRFPPIDSAWQVVWEETHPRDEKHASPFILQRLQRTNLS